MAIIGNIPYFQTNPCIVVNQQKGETIFLDSRLSGVFHGGPSFEIPKRWGPFHNDKKFGNSNTQSGNPPLLTMKNRVSNIWDNTSQLTISGPQEKARYRQMFFPKPDRFSDRIVWLKNKSQKSRWCLPQSSCISFQPNLGKDGSPVLT